MSGICGRELSWAHLTSEYVLKYVSQWFCGKDSDGRLWGLRLSAGLGFLLTRFNAEVFQDGKNTPVVVTV